MNSPHRELPWHAGYNCSGQPTIITSLVVRDILSVRLASPDLLIVVYKHGFKAALNAM